MKMAEMFAAVHEEMKPREGQIWFNPRRGNCLRIKRVYKLQDGIEVAQCMSYRPDGEKGSLPISVKVEALIKQYHHVQSIEVRTGLGQYQWSDITGKILWKPWR